MSRTPRSAGDLSRAQSDGHGCKVGKVGKLAPAPTSLCAIQSGLNTIQKLALIERLGQITDDPGPKCAGANIIARIGSYQYCGNRFAQTGQVIVQIKASHPGHVEVDNQAAGAAELRRAQEFLPRRKRLGDQPYRTHQNFDRVSNRLVVIDDGNYWSAIWHLARPETASSPYGATDVVRETLSRPT
ncbi:MAG: hypothetical protein QOI05_3704 [Bradyrhizobium sp.]|jgi:hypothetical protein|nr:hypothetical protein [Bradyrhizobium sp.]